MHGSELTASDVDDFLRTGFVRIDHAFPRALAEEARDVQGWINPADHGPGGHGAADHGDRAGGLRPASRLYPLDHEPMDEALGSPLLRSAFDRLVGPGRWRARSSPQAFPVLFASPADPIDSGWHIDVSFGRRDRDSLSWRANLFSNGRALTMMMLFSDVGMSDGPAWLRAGSHLGVARKLAAGSTPSPGMVELADDADEAADEWEMPAVGEAGTVYLCHPFMVREPPAADANHASMAEPPLLLAEPLKLGRPDGAYSPVEQAIRYALGGDWHG